ncbi:hypothetical protein ACJZ2D_014687 [Fusarium nematophilum]
MASSEKQSGGVYNAAAVSPKDTRGKRYETMPEYKAAKKHDPYKADEEKDWVILDPEEPRYTHFHKEEGTGKFGLPARAFNRTCLGTYFLSKSECFLRVPFRRLLLESKHGSSPNLNIFRLFSALLSDLPPSPLSRLLNFAFDHQPHFISLSLDLERQHLVVSSIGVSYRIAVW